MGKKKSKRGFRLVRTTIESLESVINGNTIPNITTLNYRISNYWEFVNFIQEAPFAILNIIESLESILAIVNDSQNEFVGIDPALEKSFWAFAYVEYPQDVDKIAYENNMSEKELQDYISPFVERLPKIREELEFRLNYLEQIEKKSK